METSISAGLPISGSGRVYISSRTSASGITAELGPHRTCDLRTMEVIGSKRLTSLEWVTTDVWPDSRFASADVDLLDRMLRPGVSVRTVSPDFLGHFYNYEIGQKQLSKWQLVLGDIPTFYLTCSSYRTAKIDYNW